MRGEGERGEEERGEGKSDGTGQNDEGVKEKERGEERGEEDERGEERGREDGMERRVRGGKEVEER